LAKLLLERWSWGDLSAPSIQSIAAAAIDDGAKGKELDILSRLGSKGAYPNNAHRDLERHLAPTPISEAISTIGVFMRKGQGHITKVEHPILLPHELFAKLYEHRPDEFFQRLCNGSTDNIGKFWDAMLRPPAHPACDGHTLHTIPNFKQVLIPLAFHGDGVPVAGVGRAWQKSLDVYSWCSLLSTGSTLRANFLIYAIYDKLTIKSGDMSAFGVFIELLAWSLRALYEGKWPTMDVHGRPIRDARAGTPLAGGFRGVLWVVRGDLELMNQKLGLENYNSNTPCACCRANTSNRPWTDGRATAAWRNTVWNNTNWWDARPVLSSNDSCETHALVRC
jgi:hypothetical protein